MAKTPKPKSCIVGGCTNAAVVGTRVCRNDFHPLKLQAEIERLRDTRVTVKWEELLRACEGFRESAEKLQTLRRRMQVGKSGSMAQIGVSPGFTDGTVDYGLTVLHSSSHASVKFDEGNWGAAVRLVNDLNRELGKLLDPGEPKKRDVRPTCGQCPDQQTRHRRQPVDSKFCRYCGANMRDMAETG